ncbi:conserved hypothetical protein [Leishmania major strain Friedlin]|uniref:Uncharacterized protein n=1 Tax=Leishmania major TaxID=5664 RepID=Q4QEG1_LEIMA|nr:conserved hypothetical protein [Leishmania major strain Friedlin]CAG9572258.1 hypothetical_protein_-_conserved [Leishmania major strain Friedlin]CAJ03487.1 conserved hypothetical protein [Leishmania major strain Friedlin]|eukprot:XP_001682287.1 conserved hypothetical protein [Leishmania major strain Friedlin]
MVAEASAASREEAELGAIIDALAIAPSSTEWARITRVLDSDLFVSFVALLTALNAHALVRVVRAQPARAGPATLRAPFALKTRPQFRATVAAELASIADAETVSRSQSDKIAAGNVPLRRGSAVDPQAQTLQCRQHAHHYDVGVTGDRAPSARDAIKLALFKSLDVLQDYAVDEWREAGREGALLLNELACGGCCTSEMDVRVLNWALRYGSVSLGSSCTAVAADVVLRFRCVAGSDSISVTTTPVERAPKESHTRPSCVPLGSVKESGFVVASSAPSGEAAGLVVSDEICLPFPISAVTIRRPFVDEDACRSRPALKELRWPRQCMTGATLLLLAAAKASLYRSATSTCSALMLDSNAVLEGVSTASVRCKSPVASAFEWPRAPFFSTFCDSAALQRGLFSHGESWGVESNTAQDTTDLLAQNQWHCPDVVAMIAFMRAALRLPLRSYPKITFEQTALHDPARRMQELAQGLYGDVDVLTRVHVCWETPRDCFVACAVSDPVLHHRNAIQSGSEASSRAWLSCADTGYPRGPLLLLVAAVCSLYDQVVSRVATAAAECYPMVPVKNSFARGGLDFLLFSWFEASPQVRCFTIGTTPPSYAQQPRSEATPLLDGSTHHELGPSMTRAMLFYDVLGQRVLFAETHATNAVDAVARMDFLSVEQNFPRQDLYAPPSMVAQRPFRSVSRQCRWQRFRQLLERSLQRSIAAADVTGADHLARTNQCAGHQTHDRTVVAAAVRACIGACASEAGALWTVLQVVAKVAATRAGAGAEGGGINGERGVYARQLLSARLLEDSGPTAEPFAGEAGSEADRGWWTGGHDVTWNCRPLGKEAAPPRAGVMEAQLCMGASLGAAAMTDGKQAAVASVEVIILRCRVDAVRSSASEVTEAEWLCEKRVTEPPSLCCFGTVTLTTAQAVSGIFPALALLCRRALEYIYSEARYAPLVSILPPMSDVLAWCAAAAPMFAGTGSGYLPYEPRFYAAPKLLGELLQGAAGKYRCSYSIPPPRDRVTSAASGTDWGEGCAEVERERGEAAQPSTIFYTSKPIHVDTAANEYATRGQHGSRLAKPPAVACTLYLESLMGNGASPSAPAVSPMCPAPVAIPFVLGHGVGRTKREAWRSAAWQAVRLQFPAVLAQLEAYRDVSELLQRPAQLNQLVRSSGLDRNSVWGGVAPVVYKLNFDCSVLFPSSVRNAATEVAASASVQAVRRSQCGVTAVRTDGSKLCVVPGCTATAASSGEAYTTAVAIVLRAVRGAAQEAAAHMTGATMGTTASRTAWAALSPSSPGSVSGAACSPDLGPYAAWRDTTHNGKSIWHAYAGALSAYLDSDVVVHLVAAEDASVDELGSLSRGVGSGRRLSRRVMLSRVQVRMRDGRSGAATAAGNVPLGFADQQPWASRRITSFGAFSVAAGSGAVDASVGGGADGILLECTAASLFARRWSPLGTGASGTRVGAVAAAAPPLTEHPSRLLQEITRWLSDITQQCGLPLKVREELRGLLCARACDLARIQDSYRSTPAERVEALLMRWVGRRAQVRIRRINSSVVAYPSLANQMVWVAEALVEIQAERRCPGSRSSSHAGLSLDGNALPLLEQDGELKSCAGTRERLDRPWVAARAVGATGNEAAWQLYRHVCNALRDLVATEPSPRSVEKQRRQ